MAPNPLFLTNFQVMLRLLVLDDMLRSKESFDLGILVPQGKRENFIKTRVAQEIYDCWDFPSDPVIKTSPSNAKGEGLIPGQGADIPLALWPINQNIKQKQHCHKFSKDFKNGF